MINKLINRFIIFIRVAKHLFISQYALMLEYRAEITLWALSGTLPLIMLGLWLGSGSLNEVFTDSKSIARYFISVFIVRQFTAVWVMYSFEEDQIEGRLSPYLLQPMCPFWRYFFSHIAEQISRFPIVIIMMIILFSFLPQFFWIPKFTNFILTFVFVFWGFILRFLLHWSFSMLCFWNERASSIERLLLIPYIFLSGLVAPLESFPSHISNFALLTPFPYFISMPAKILSENSVDYTKYLLAMVFWSLTLLSTSLYLWKKGVRKYSGMGA